MNKNGEFYKYMRLQVPLFLFGRLLFIFMSHCTSNSQPELQNSAISLYLEQKNQDLSSNALGRFSSRKHTDDVRPQSASSDDSFKFLQLQESVDKKAEVSGEKKKKKKKKKNRKRKAKKNQLDQSQLQPHNISMTSSKNIDSADEEEEKGEESGVSSGKEQKNDSEVLQLSPSSPSLSKQSPDIALEEILQKIDEKEKDFGSKESNSFKECVDKEQASFQSYIPLSNIDEPDLNEIPQIIQPNEVPSVKTQMIAQKKPEKDTVHNKYWKTRICFDHQNKRCKKSAEECNYAHGKSDLRPLKNKKLQKEEGKEKKTKEGTCYKFVNGNCKKSQRECQYLHDQQYANRRRNTEKKEKQQAELKYNNLKKIEDDHLSSSFHDVKADEKRKAEIEAINQAYIIHQPLKSHPGFAFPREPQPYPPSTNPSYCIPTYSMPVYFPYWNHPMPDTNTQMQYQYPSFPPNFQHPNYPLGQNMGSNSSASNSNPSFSPYYMQPSYLKPEEKN